MHAEDTPDQSYHLTIATQAHKNLHPWRLLDHFPTSCSQIRDTTQRDPKALLTLPSTTSGGEVEDGPLKTSQILYFRLTAVSDLALIRSHANATTVH